MLNVMHESIDLNEGTANWWKRPLGALRMLPKCGPHSHELSLANNVGHK